MPYKSTLEHAKPGPNLELGYGLRLRRILIHKSAPGAKKNCGLTPPRGTNQKSARSRCHVVRAETLTGALARTPGAIGDARRKVGRERRRSRMGMRQTGPIPQNPNSAARRSVYRVAVHNLADRGRLIGESTELPRECLQQGDGILLHFGNYDIATITAEHGQSCYEAPGAATATSRSATATHTHPTPKLCWQFDDGERRPICSPSLSF